MAQIPLWKTIVHWLGYGLGSGLIPGAPGTFGTVAAIPLFWLMSGLAPVVYMLIVIGLFVAGVFICAETAMSAGAKDPGFIVYDEIVGFLVAMYMLPFDWRWLLAGFVIYRFFDILKPFPIGWIEDKLGLGLSIMADDVIAGIYTFIILLIAQSFIK